MKHVWTTLAITAASALSLPLNAATPATGSTETAVSSSAMSGEGWVADFDVAVKQAREQGKHLLVDFTGSDWCGWCIKLHDEVFAKEAFLKAAQEKYVLVALDFPRDQAIVRG